MAIIRRNKSKQETGITEVFGEIRQSVDAGDTYYIPDVLEFCYSKRYLNLTQHGIKLYPMQQITLKCFYRGQPGNEHIKLEKEELELLHRYKLVNVIDRYYSGELFRELVLVFGRRSGKDFLTSLIALYETMKLLEVPGGCPFRHYNIAPGNPIYILTVATSSDQAGILYQEIKVKMQTSSFFKNRMGGVEADRISLLTREDQRRNAELEEAGLQTAQTKGSVVIMSGHSNSEGLLGKRIWCLLLDEVASFKATGGATSGDRIYSALGPATADFKRVIGEKENGDPITITDSKIISISSPRAEEGVLFKMYTDSFNPDIKNRLAIRLPTWRVNLAHTEEALRAEFKFMNPNEFNMEFGAEFSGTAGEKFIADRYVDEAIQMGAEIGLDVDRRKQGVPGILYYAHLDPAATSHNYALVVLHVEDRIRRSEKEDVNGVLKQRKEKFKLFVVDHIMVWQPSPGKAVNVFDVDQYVIDLSRRFRFAMVTYDAWNSLASTQRLRSKGVPTKVTPYRKQYKMAIYDRLEHLLVNHQLALPHKGKWSTMLEQELKCLKRIYKMQGYQIKPDEEGLITTDDLCDALAGAIGEATESTYGGYPKAGVVSMPQSRSGGEQQWNIGSGSYTNQQYGFMVKKFGW